LGQKAARESRVEDAVVEVGAKLIPRPARYLLRIDDLCPTVSCERWQRWCALIEEFQICPILAIVPDNQDAELRVSPPDPQFWDQMRVLQSSGATIGLHGYRHLCSSQGRSLVPLSEASEFAGVAARIQHAWIREGLRILRGHGLEPRIWVAPRHGFDRNTLLALRAEGIQLLSDGFARRPFLRDGITWIPQQLWAPVDKREGLWTICVHPTTTDDSRIEALRVFIQRRVSQLTSVDEALEESHPSGLDIGERIDANWMLWRIRLSRARRHLQSGSRKRIEDQVS
jgi:predicted deacetylase